ncbi:HECT-domain-containing protein [Fomitiporia mediterranea MF3/22]|uniref:HECT-domain-containing protein n=1 Tax=Fomitiporia mediterranea (strain MF3/22) TaxID=694068 RepID=UPI0004408075|nr:HECT-domain-containing protein [Fomitiporia mediterranea MF3/22]EJC97865.1 HECT-domain-containing protein [Fomitiporia mediterranea MF3/22]
MQPLFDGDDRQKRLINLGGASTVASHDDVLQNARAGRNERLQQRRSEEAAITIQSLWRGHVTRRRVRAELASRFDSDPSSIDAMRCLVLLKDDEERLCIWSEHIVSDGQAELASGPEQGSWLVLVCQLAVQLLRSVSRDSSSQYANTHLTLINGLLDPSLAQSRTIMFYLSQHNYYPILKDAVERINIDARKTSSALPLLVPLFTAPFNLASGDSKLYSTYFAETARYILTIPLLLYRLPLQSLSAFSARLPLHEIHLLNPNIGSLTAMPLKDRLHLLANLSALMPPRYKFLKTAQPLETFLKLLSSLLSGLPAHAFEAPASDAAQSSWAHDEDSDDEEMQPAAGPSSAPKQPPKEMLEVDSKTRTRLSTLGSHEHVCALIAASVSFPSTRLALYAFFMALYTVWPTSRLDILSSVLGSAGGGLVRELYRGYVRGSPLAKEGDDNVRTLTDPTHGNDWLPLLFLTDIYTQALLTMGDDEFFASRMSAASTTSKAVYRNPLTVDEVVSFSRQLMNIAFTLYWNESAVSEGTAPGTPVAWEIVRDKMTKLLQAIHARDSRRPFTPQNHWLCSSQIDLNSFIEAAVSEDQTLSASGNTFSHRGGRATNKRLLTHLSPRLGILNNIPFAIPFETRVEIFRTFVRADMIAFAGSTSRYERAHMASRARVVVHRGNVAADGFDKLANMNLKGLIEIQFVDQFGNTEAGIDGGGVFKEFFTSLCKEVFDTDRGLWLATKQNELYPNPHSYAKEPHSLEWYRFIGRILGKALYEGILVDVAFAGFFLAKWLGKQSYLDDLASLDPELYQGLLFLKNYDDNPQDLSLTFAVSEEEFGAAKTRELIPNGSNTPVTKENRLPYIYLMCHYHLSKKIRSQSEAFFEGLSEMIDPKWIRMFNQQELQILIGGVNAPIDLDDLRKNTNYGGFKDDDPVIEAFWRVVSSFDQEQRRMLLRFVTSCSRPPLLGFKELQPLFSIRRASEDQSRLPTASTCVNLLKLPAYQDERVMKSKLLQAISSGAGFDLS